MKWRKHHPWSNPCYNGVNRLLNGFFYAKCNRNYHKWSCQRVGATYMSLSKASVFINITANYMLFFLYDSKICVKRWYETTFCRSPLPQNRKTILMINLICYHLYLILNKLTFWDLKLIIRALYNVNMKPLTYD